MRYTTGDLIEIVHDNDITTEDRQFAYQWLTSWARAESNLQYFTLHELGILIVYEVNNKRRTYVVDRLLGRYAKSLRQQHWQALQKLMEEKNARARNRAISLSTRIGERRDSDKADLFK